MSDNKLFGTDGVRGVANVYPMTVDFAVRLGKAVAKLVCVKHKKVAIAKDTRISSDMLEAALAAGFMSQGVDVVLLGIIPTPAVTKMVASLEVDMAVMITASHNPYQDNGIKLITSDGDKFSDEITVKIEQTIEKDDFVSSSEKIGCISYYNLLEEYKKNALSVIEGDKPLAGMKVVLDCANGCFSAILPEVFIAYGAEVMALSKEPNGFNINFNCGSQHTENMCNKVVELGADIGIAVDGDGDRIIVCDEKGKVLNGDQIIAFLGQYLKQQNKLKADTVVATIVSNPALDNFLQKNGINCIRSAVGERYVIDEMKKIGANIGGEESGHIVVSDFAKTGDAMMAGLLLASGIWNSKCKMSEIFPLFEPMTKKRVDTKFATKQLMNEAFNNPIFKEMVIKGEEKLIDKGKLLIRKSGTEPKIQVWVWNDDGEQALAIAQEISDVLQNMEGYETSRNVN